MYFWFDLKIKIHLAIGLSVRMFFLAIGFQDPFSFCMPMMAVELEA
jgi:hypothetical protein